jgi:LacI family transcriptional regulator
MKSPRETTDITLAHVAEKANVSVTTAARVLNGTATSIPISQKSREKVLAAAEQLAYVPNHAARSLKQGKMQAIGILANSATAFKISGEFTAIVLSSLLRTALKHHYHLTFLTGQAEPFTQWDLLKAIGMVDAVVVVNRDLEKEPALVEGLKNIRKPVIYAIDYPDAPDIFAFSADDVQGGTIATEFLLERNHRRIGFVRHDFYKDIFDRRETGWKMALQKKNIQVSEEDIMEVETLKIDPFKKREITALICANEHIARKTKRILNRNQLRVPEDVEILSFFHETSVALFSHDDLESFSLVTQPLEQVVASSIDLAVELAEGKVNASSPKKTLFPYRVIPAANKSS